MSLAGERDLVDRLSALTAWLGEHGDLWRQSPFVLHPVPWSKDRPELSDWLLSLSADAITRLERDERVPDQPEVLSALFAARRALTSVECGALEDVEALPAKRSVRFRKGVQIAALADLSLPLVHEHGLNEVIDWCSGKGHLGRSIAQATQSSLTLVERDEVLCSAGQRLAISGGVTCTVLHQDVLASEVAGRLPGGGLIVGLHACGALGERLLDTAVRTRQRCVVYAPCCYHRGYPEAPYRPMSQVARASGLELMRSDLRLPTLDEAVASPKKRARRLREQSWRLAVDELVRQATGRDHYTPLGPTPKAWLAGAFEEFAKRITARAGLPLPITWAPQEALALGVERAKAARALGAVRSIFRRPLEFWLVLDRALYLQERGYNVSVLRFCAPTISPRNLVVLARPC